MASIGNSAFYNCTNLTFATIPGSVTSVEEYTFFGCSSLTSITIPEDVTSIGDYAFSGCSSLTSITIPEDVTSIGDYAFSGCSSLASIAIPESVTSIGGYAFSGCNSLASITIPEGVASIGEYTFSGCSSLTSITIPDGVTSVGEYAFRSCSSLASIIIPESVTSIGNSAFLGCSNLTSITIPEGVTSIGNYAFSGCSSLASITIPEGVTSIGSYAFSGCSSLASITIPEGVTSIGDYAFDGCNSLVSITIPESVTSIGGYAFYDCNSLTAINIPKDVASIGNNAFSGCTGELIVKSNIATNAFVGSKFTKVVIGESVTSIGNNAFDDCTVLNEIVFEDGSETLSLGYNYSSSGAQGLFYDCPLETIYWGRKLNYDTGYLPFSNKKELKCVVIGRNVTEIKSKEFSSCSSLSSITIPEGVTSIGDYAFEACDSLVSITIPEGMTSIGEYAFSACYSLSSITIPESVASIENSTFSGCSSLTSITIPESVTSIGNYAFSGCSNLVFITIPWGVASIGNYALYNCSNLTSITIPKSVTNIGSSAFEGCTGELTVNCLIPSASSHEEGAFYKSKFSKVTIGKDVAEIGNYAFFGCTSLKGVIIEDGETTLSLGYNSYNGSYAGGSGLFSSCPLETVYLGRNLSYNTDFHYGRSPFYNITELTNVVIGNDVTEIRDFAFGSCENMSSLTIGSSVLSIGRNAFSTPNKTIWLTNTPPTDYANTRGRINYVSNDRYENWSNKKVYPYLSSMFEVEGVIYVPVSPAERICDAIDCVYNNADSVLKVSETVSFKGVEMTVREVMPYTFSGNKYLKDASLQNNGDVGNHAFYSCDSLKSVILGDKIAILGDNAFSSCKELQDIVIPDSIKSVGSYCFDGCTALESVVIGAGVTTINDYTFQNCSSLPEITIPQTVTKIGDYVFSGCSNLSDLVIVDRTDSLALGSNGWSALFADCSLDSVYIGGKIVYNTGIDAGYSPFYRNTSLRTVVITDREKHIYDNEFYGCTALENVAIGNGVKSIGNYAFSGCSSLKAFSFGCNMASVGAEAFSDCTNLMSITSNALVPPTCGAQALDDINKWSCALKVPQNYASAYQTADQWKEFFFIEDVIELEMYLLTYIVDGETYHTESVMSGNIITLVDEPTKEGYTFSGWREVPEFMPAEDLTISGTFTVNVYKVYYYVGDELVRTEEVTFGDAIPEYIYEPINDGETFLGWVGKTYETMPANDVIYVANIENGIEQLLIGDGQLAVYDLSGRKLQVEDLHELSAGTYIVNGRKMVIK